MPEKLTDLSVSAFTERLAGRTAVPGGGGAAALTGAQGVALILMAGQFTLGKKKYAEYEDDIPFPTRRMPPLSSPSPRPTQFRRKIRIGSRFWKRPRKGLLKFLRAF